MNPESNRNQKTEFADAAAKFGDSSLGEGLGLCLILTGPFVAGALIIAASQWDGHLYDRKGCVQLQEVNGQIFKMDTCTGDSLRLQQDKEAE